jgi:hypothetical protein
MIIARGSRGEGALPTLHDLGRHSGALAIAREPESITTGQNYAESIGVMDSGLAHPSTSAQERAPE